MKSIILTAFFGLALGWLIYGYTHHGVAVCDDSNTKLCEKSVNAILIVTKRGYGHCYGDQILVQSTKRKDEFRPTTKPIPKIMGFDSNIECFEIEGTFKDAFKRGANYVTGDLVTGANVFFYSTVVTTVRGKGFCHRWVDGEKQSCSAKIKAYGQ